ncbi:MAG: cyclic nucleotide-binding domain-containing protein [Planctomycetota bacterium]
MSATETKKVRPLRAVLKSPDLRSVQLSWLIARSAFWGWAVTMNAVAYLEGGAVAVGLFLAVRIVPGALLTPIISVLSDRMGILRCLGLLGWFRTVPMAAMAVMVFYDAPFAWLLAISAFEGLGSMPQETEHLKAIPWLAKTPAELTAANSVTELGRMGGILLGPLLSSVLLGVTAPFVSLVVFAVMGGVATLLLSGMGGRIAPTSGASGRSIWQSLKGGARFIVGDRDLLTMIGWCAWMTICTASLQVYTAELAIDFLSLEDSGPALLTGLFGLGGIVGGLLSFLLIGRKNLAAPATAGAIVMGGFTAFMGLWPERWPVFFAMGLIGGGMIFLSVSLWTILQRGIPVSQHGPTFGLSALISRACLGLAGIVGYSLTAALGLRWALATTGLSLIGVSVLSLFAVRRMLTRADAFGKEVSALEATSVFSVLPIGPLERVASVLKPVTLGDGDVAVRQGDVGNHLYIVVSGTLEVTADGAEVGTLAPGDIFGEIALLENRLRSATVKAAGACELYRLHRDELLAAFETNPESDRLVRELARSRQRATVEAGERAISDEGARVG